MLCEKEDLELIQEIVDELKQERGPGPLLDDWYRHPASDQEIADALLRAFEN